MPHVTDSAIICLKSTVGDFLPSSCLWPFLKTARTPLGLTPSGSFSCHHVHGPVIAVMSPGHWCYRRRADMVEVYVDYIDFYYNAVANISVLQLASWPNMTSSILLAVLLNYNSAALAWHVHKHKDRVSHQGPQQPSNKGTCPESWVWGLISKAGGRVAAKGLLSTTAQRKGP